MAMVRINPMKLEVGCDWVTGRPRTVRLGRERIPVTGLARIREEAAAYPAEAGPRTLFEIETPSARLAVAYEHRRRRWVLQGLDPELEPLTPAA
jgi:hypothetical protein